LSNLAARRFRTRRLDLCGSRYAQTASAGLHGLGEFREEFIGKLLGGAIDEPLAELRQLSADLGLDIITEERAPSFSANATVAPPLAKPATPPSPSPEIL
jgi:hypothetical protein